MADTVVDDVFIDDITVPAMDGHPLARNAVSAPRRQAPRRADQFGHRRAAQALPGLCQLPRRARLRGADLRLSRHRRLAAAGDEREQAADIAGRLQGLDVGLGGAGHHRRGVVDARALQDAAVRLCRTFVRRPGARPAAEQHRDPARALHCGAGRLLETDDGAGAVSRLRHPEFRRRSPRPFARLPAGQGRPRHGPAEGRVPAMGRAG